MSRTASDKRAQKLKPRQSRTASDKHAQRMLNKLKPKSQRSHERGGGAAHLRASDIDDAEHPGGHICHRVILQREPTPHARHSVEIGGVGRSATRKRAARVLPETSTPIPNPNRGRTLSLARKPSGPCFPS